MTYDRDVDGVTCPRAVTSRFTVAYGSPRCGRPITRDGLCGLHAASDERVRRNDELIRQKQRDRIARDNERARQVTYANNLAMLLGDLLGVPVGVRASGGPVAVVLDLDDAERLRQKLTAP